MEKLHLEIAQDGNKEKNHSICPAIDENLQFEGKFSKYTKIFVKWGLLLFCLFLFGRGIYIDALKHGVLFIIPKIAIVFTVVFSAYSWKMVICKSFLLQKKEHLFYHTTILGIVIGLFGAVSGNPWFLFFLTSRSLNGYLSVLVFFMHLALWGSISFIENPSIQKVISAYPTIASLIVTLEETFTEKDAQCTYKTSRKYLLNLSIVFVSFCIIGLGSSSHISSISCTV